MHKKTRIIILNGTSSSGKTSLAKEIQRNVSDTYLHCSLDAFWNMTPQHIAASSVNFPNIKQAMAKSVCALAETGHNVIVDTVFSAQKTQTELIHELNQFDPVFVKLYCPLDELTRREAARGDRKLGLAGSQVLSVHKQVNYDLEIDTHLNSISQCAQLVLQFYDSKK